MYACSIGHNNYHKNNRKFTFFTSEICVQFIVNDKCKLFDCNFAKTVLELPNQHYKNFD